MTIDRRTFVGALAGPVLLRAERRWRAALAHQSPRHIIDGLGEIRIEYDTALLDEIRASGLTGALVTVGNPALPGATAFQDMADEVAAYERHIATHASRLELLRSGTGFDRAASAGRIGILLYTQNASPLEDDVDRVAVLRQLGVRVIQLTYNTRNLLGDGCLERTNVGLSTFGLEVVARMNTERMLVDVSHCGEATSLDAMHHSTAPVVVTHSGCRAVFDHPRNKSDQVLRTMADGGGMIGIMQLNPYLGPRERNTLEEYMAHIDHAIDVAGVEHVGIGSDREYKTIPDTEAERLRLEQELARLRPSTSTGFRWPFFLSELNHPRRMETIAEALRRRGRSAREVDLIMGGNFRRLFGEVLG